LMPASEYFFKEGDPPQNEIPFRRKREVMANNGEYLNESQGGKGTHLLEPVMCRGGEEKGDFFTRTELLE